MQLMKDAGIEVSTDAGEMKCVIESSHEAQLKIGVLNEESPSTPNGMHTHENNLQTYAVAKLLQGAEKSF